MKKKKNKGMKGMKKEEVNGVGCVDFGAFVVWFAFLPFFFFFHNVRLALVQGTDS